MPTTDERPPSKPVRTVACPQCGTPVEWSTRALFRPFCSQRCKMIDLGAWAAEHYRVADDNPPDDER